MARYAAILGLLALVLAVPFALRPSRSESAWREGDPVLIIVTPHNEAIRHEFGRGFSKWHEAKFGRPVKVEWRAIGGTTEIMRFLTSEYASAAKDWWRRKSGKPWPAKAGEAIVDRSSPADPEILE